jgi:hypothetical protein
LSCVGKKSGLLGSSESLLQRWPIAMRHTQSSLVNTGFPVTHNLSLKTFVEKMDSKWAVECDCDVTVVFRNST